jgi:hypothetical protein
MPKTAVNENRGVATRQNYVGPPRQPSPMQPVADPRSPQRSANSQFWTCVSCPNAGHRPTANCRVGFASHECYL